MKSWKKCVIHHLTFFLFSLKSQKNFQFFAIAACVIQSIQLGGSWFEFNFFGLNYKQKT